MLNKATKGRHQHRNAKNMLTPSIKRFKSAVVSCHPTLWEDHLIFLVLSRSHFPLKLQSWRCRIKSNRRIEIMPH